MSGASISLGLVAGDLFCPFDFSCFFLYLVKFRMGSTHLKKQTSLLVFMDVFCVRRDLHPSAQLESLGSSQTFLWMYLLWTCVCKFPIVAICLQALTVFCSLWCLSTVLQVLWSCHKLPSSPFVLNSPRVSRLYGSCQSCKSSKIETGLSRSP